MPRRPQPDPFASAPLDLTSLLAQTAADLIAPRPEQEDPATEAAERSLLEFTKQAWHVVEPAVEYVDGWHMGCVAEHLQAMTELQIRNLILNEPPRHSKSLQACVMWFCWSWAKDPSSQWIYGAYGENLAVRDSNRCRDLIASPWYQARWGHKFRLKRAENAASRFANNRRGVRIATTILGKALGEGGSHLVVDDPMKATEARSEAHRQAVIDSWSKTMATRGNDPKTVRRLVVMQRLHSLDLSGWILSERGGFEHLVLPAEYEPARYFLPDAQKSQERPPKDAIIPTSLQRARPELLDGPTGSGRQQEGDLLWPERFGRAEIDSLKLDLQAVGSAGQLQQRPSPVEGTIFRAEFFKHFTTEHDARGNLVLVLPIADSEPEYLPALSLRFFQVADTALKRTARSAFTCVSTFAWDRARRRLFVWHVWQTRLEVHEQLPALEQLRDGAGHFDPVTRKWPIPGTARRWPRPLAIQAVESKASGIGILQEAALNGHPLTEVKADAGGGDKVLRAATAATMYAQGRIWHRAGQQWIPDYEDQLCSFPSGAYADAVDTVAHGAVLANSDALLNASIDRDLVVADYGPSRHEEMTETISVGNHRVVFDDDTGW